VSEDTKKVGKTEPAATELSEQDLEKVAGGTANVPTVSEIIVTKEDSTSPKLF
jgi:hypothetical protein